MNRLEIIKTIKELASSQGFYGRLLSYINELENEQKEELFEYLENENFKNPLDLVLFFEC